MPIYEFACGDCSAVFETLVRNGTRVACPACRSEKVERLMSAPAAHRGSAGGAQDFSCLGPPAGGCCGGACHGHSH
ncbi:MAG: FmdB family zinc ribbon protein [Gemmatimonadota bacterium]